MVSTYISIVSNSRRTGRYLEFLKRDPTSSRLASFVISLLSWKFTSKRTERELDDGRVSYNFSAGHATLLVQIIASTVVAISGGSLLIMSFDANRTKSLVTVSCSVLLFGCFLGAVIRGKSSEIFVATATYAAVLVVFVGTSTNGTR
jgi:hypothetical protein